MNADFQRQPPAEDAMTDAIEVTTFELADCSVADFVAANQEVDAWLRLQPGFRSRAIALKPDGSIVDVLR